MEKVQGFKEVKSVDIGTVAGWWSTRYNNSPEQKIERDEALSAFRFPCLLSGRASTNRRLLLLSGVHLPLLWLVQSHRRYRLRAILLALVLLLSGEQPRSDAGELRPTISAVHLSVDDLLRPVPNPTTGHRTSERQINAVNTLKRRRQVPLVKWFESNRLIKLRKRAKLFRNNSLRFSREAHCGKKPSIEASVRRTSQSWNRICRISVASEIN